MEQQLHEGAIKPSRLNNYPEWYQQVIKEADLAENTPVRGCMVIKPWGYALWEMIKAVLDRKIKETGHENACFPLLIPLSFLEKEAEHIEGFAKECAVVTHHRLEKSPDGGLQPAGKLEEPYIIRPTSETIIGYHYAKWVQSYRDLPILINQWANVMRWEMRPRLFLRTSEFFWQEGHTVHATAEEAVLETVKMLDVYTDFAREYMAIPMIKGIKTKDERFPGAVETYTVEAMMQDRKALQAGTSHFLGQNFAKSCEIKFSDRSGQSQYAWTTSWGMTSRMVGALIMVHGDDDGLVIPPRIAPTQVILLPITKPSNEASILAFCKDLKMQLERIYYDNVQIRVKIDSRDLKGGDKYWQSVKKGIPIRLEIGQKELDGNRVYMSRRDTGAKAKVSLSKEELIENIPSILAEMQNSLYEKALAYREKNTHYIETLENMRDFFQKGEGGFAVCHCIEEHMDLTFLKELKVTARCIPLLDSDIANSPKDGLCIFSKKKTQTRIVFSQSY